MIDINFQWTRFRMYEWGGPSRKYIMPVGQEVLIASNLSRLKGKSRFSSGSLRWTGPRRPVSILLISGGS